MVSCPEEILPRLRPILANLGKVFYCGDRPGLAQSMKLANNFLSATGMAASSEAIAMGVKAGLDPSLMCEVINAGSGMNTATTQKFPRSVLPGTFDYGFGMALMVKDVRLFLAEAEVQSAADLIGISGTVGSRLVDRILLGRGEVGGSPLVAFDHRSRQPIPTVVRPGFTGRDGDEGHHAHERYRPAVHDGSCAASRSWIGAILRRPARSMRMFRIGPSTTA